MAKQDEWQEKFASDELTRTSHIHMGHKVRRAQQPEHSIRMEKRGFLRSSTECQLANSKLVHNDQKAVMR